MLELLHAGGPDAVTVEAVAARSGVAKTTIYRRHENRVDLLRATVTAAVGEPMPLLQGSVREKIRDALRQTWGQMAKVLGPGGLAAMVAEADPEFARLFRQTLQPFEDTLAARIDEDARAGLLRPDTDAEAAVSLFVGAYLGELVRRGSVDDGWLDRCLEMMWAAIAPHEGES
ncbi:TetR/AcrR family transcriptional regulator [Nocardioides ginsengisoli]|uniref:TetR/AcrR family transcriptional regulator n=1 Tax=Nocardioides ginsengisoli TaxID=363868 RepID=A0ABW3VWE4_9ACTN